MSPVIKTSSLHSQHKLPCTGPEPATETADAGVNTVEYRADIAGLYIVRVLYAGEEVTGSPFNVKVNAVGEADKVIILSQCSSHCSHVLFCPTVSVCLSNLIPCMLCVQLTNFKLPHCGTDLNPWLSSSSQSVSIYSMCIYLSFCVYLYLYLSVYVAGGDGDAVIPVNRSHSITMDTSRAGEGHVTCDVTTADTGLPVPVTTDADADEGLTAALTVLRYTPTVCERHHVNVYYGGQLIPAGHFQQQVSTTDKLTHTDRQTNTDQ